MNLCILKFYVSKKKKNLEKMKEGVKMDLKL